MSYSKKTAVLATSTKAEKYSYLAVERLIRHGHDVVPLGYREGEINGTEILLDFPVLSDIHTVTLYLNPKRQVEHYDYILSLKPKRIIFNPGTENEELQKLAEENGIQIQIGCTLVMLSVGNY